MPARLPQHSHPLICQEITPAISIIVIGSRLSIALGSHLVHISTCAANPNKSAGDQGALMAKRLRKQSPRERTKASTMGFFSKLGTYLASTLSHAPRFRA
eukprot:scaffold246_cov242-Pinguiococcus_pyrenoidosus.AAC.16